MTSIQNIVQQLTEASNAYYNLKPIMSDETFDALLETLKERDPTNAFLKEVGAPPSEGAVLLPVCMPSLEKIKPGMPALGKFITAAKTYVLSEKLDGLSGLWCPKKKELFLRGDGSTGQSVSHLVGKIAGLVPSSESWIIRGELVLPKTSVDSSQIARTIVNGLVHKSDPDLTLLKQIQFLAYEVINPPGLKRSDQFKWLKTKGFLLPWFQVKESPSELDLKTAFIERRANSIFDTDGIVIGVDQIPIVGNREIGSTEPPKPPKDCVAFKMAVSEQSAETTVLEIVWAPSSHGYLIPRIRIEPVKIGGATIEFCTGHNARTIVDKGLGDGARIRIRRSGDVIPTLDEVLVPAQPSLPTKYQWKWDGPEETATHLLVIGESAEQQTSQLVRFAKELDIPGLGPGHCRTLVNAGIVGPATLWAQTPDQLATILGPKTGKTLYANLRTALGPRVTELQLLLASNQLPRSVGETKLKSLLQEVPDPREWTKPLATIPAGWTQDSLTSFQSTFGDYEQWRRTELHFLPYPLGNIIVTSNPLPSNPVATKRVCFTGFRDKALEDRAEKAGFEVVQTVSSKLTCLVTPNGATKSSEKVKKAETLGIEILECSVFNMKYLS